MFKSKEERLMELAEQERQEKAWEEERELRYKKAKDKFIEDLRNKICKNSIVCVHTDNIEHKELALNLMVEMGLKCVQNDVACTNYTVHYVLTFVKNSAIDTYAIK